MCDEFSKIKIWDVHFFCFSMLVKKAYTLMTSMEQQKIYTSQIFDFRNFITHFLKWSEEHFSKYQNMRINDNLSTRLAKLPVIFFIEGGKRMDANFSSSQYLCPGRPEFSGLHFERSKFDQPWLARIPN